MCFLKGGSSLAPVGTVVDHFLLKKGRQGSPEHVVPHALTAGKIPHGRMHIWEAPRWLCLRKCHALKEFLNTIPILLLVHSMPTLSPKTFSAGEADLDTGIARLALSHRNREWATSNGFPEQNALNRGVSLLLGCTCWKALTFENSQAGGSQGLKDPPCLQDLPTRNLCSAAVPTCSPFWSFGYSSSRPHESLACGPRKPRLLD